MMYYDDLNFFELIALLNLLYAELIEPETDDEAFNNLHEIREVMKEIRDKKSKEIFEIIKGCD